MKGITLLLTVFTSFSSLVFASVDCPKFYGSYELEVYQNGEKRVDQNVFIGLKASSSLQESELMYAIYDQISVDSQNIFSTLVLGSDDNGCYGIINDGNNGFIVPPGSFKKYREVEGGKLYEVVSFPKVRSLGDRNYFEAFRIKKIIKN